MGLAGVTLIDMKTRLNTSYDHLSNVIMCRHAASLFGTALGGFVSNRLRARLDGCLTVATLGMAISFLGICMVKNIYAIAVFYALSGLCSGAAYVGNVFVNLDNIILFKLGNFGFKIIFSSPCF